MTIINPINNGKFSIKLKKKKELKKIQRNIFKKQRISNEKKYEFAL